MSLAKSNTVPAADERYMRLALDEARLAGAENEVPVGAVLVRDGAILARDHNRPIGDADPTAHAEVRVLRAAAAAAGNYRLPGTTLYVTLEPCIMCVGAMLHARVARVVYAAADPKTGALGGAFDALAVPLPHTLAVSQGPLGDVAGELLQAFFRARRRSGSSPSAEQGS